MGKRRRIPTVEGALPEEGARLRYQFPEAELDLHGKRVAQARTATRSFLRTQARIRSGAVVRIITGKGLNSEGPPKIRDMVEGELEADTQSVESWELSVDRGSYLVRLK